jgi:lipopolysaccharide biosynthesis regulator YciM
MFELPPLLLALAFVAVGVAAWFLGRRSGASRTVRLPRDYYVGLDHLINDRFDHAAEIFARMAAGDGETAEIQFALGNLFRRRGEVDRAIAIHTRLKEEGGPRLRDKAAFALALDYFSAGLMDRAEGLLTELVASPEHRAAAQDRLLRIYESQGDWANALRIFHELPLELQQERRRVAAHYLCELAERALIQGESERACALLRQARAHDPDLPRADVLTARLIEQGGDARGAVTLYLKALEVSPELALEIVPRLLAISRRQGGTDPLGELTGRLRQTGGLTSRQLLWLLITALPSQDVDRLPFLAGELGYGSQGASEAASLRVLLRRIGHAGGRYQCEDCGLHSVGWYWRCPKCRSWDSMRPAVFKWAQATDEAAGVG